MYAEYDPSILQEFADRLYARANRIIFTSGALYAVVCAAVGYTMGLVTTQSVVRGGSSDTASTVAIIFGIFGAAAGVMRGWEKSFMLKLEAQRTLLQMRIEENTRVAKTAAAAIEL